MLVLLGTQDNRSLEGDRYTFALVSQGTVLLKNMPTYFLKIKIVSSETTL